MKKNFFAILLSILLLLQSFSALSLAGAEKGASLLGDVNGDQRLSVADLVLTVRILSHAFAYPHADLDAADLNCDQLLTTADAVIIGRLLLNPDYNFEPTQKEDLGSKKRLWASAVVGKEEASRPAYAVKWEYHSESGDYYLCLPTEGELSALQLWWDGAKYGTVNGKIIQNGEKITFLKEGAYAVTIGGENFSLKVMKSAHIGSMYITTESGNMQYIHQKKGNKESGTMRFVDAAGNEIYDGALKEIKGRGNATWDKPKKPYQIKLDKKTELVEGAGKSGTWLLLANYCEKTMVHNAVAFGLAYDAGLTETSLFSYLDLYCNGKYMGTYLVCEKVQIGENRIEIEDLEKATEKLNSKDPDSYPTFGTKKTVAGTCKGYEIPNNPADITGGYLLELDFDDRYAAEASGFVTTRGVAVVIKEPEFASREQVAYISNFFQEFEDALHTADGINPTTGKRFDEYFDLESLAKKYLLEEYVKNNDADGSSQFYYKPADSQSTVGFCGPVWDYDNGFDEMIHCANKNGLFATTIRKKVYHYLMKHDFFVEKVKEVWVNDYLPSIAVCLGEEEGKGISRSIDEYYEMLTPSANMNYLFWGEIDQPINNQHVLTGKTYQEHFNYLRSYLRNRRAELNTIWKIKNAS